MTTTTEIKAPSKMQLARKVYEEIFTRGYNLNGKTQRAAFIERCIAEIGMTKHGASTYYQNISNQVNKGMKLYAYNKPASKSKKKVTKAEVVQAEQALLLSLPLLTKERWMVLDNQGQEVHCFSSRTKAQEFAKANDLKWADRNKAA